MYKNIIYVSLADPDFQNMFAERLASVSRNLDIRTATDVGVLSESFSRSFKFNVCIYDEVTEKNISSDWKSDDGRIHGVCADAVCGHAGQAEPDQVWQTEEEKTALVESLAAATGAVVVVKGWHTMVCSPDGTLKFNTTGNPGMAKGGSGDVLTGLVTGLLARGFTAADAAAAGVWIHGHAGDSAAALIGEESMNASDILAHIRI